MAADAYDVRPFDPDGILVDVGWSYTRGVFDEVGDRRGYRSPTDRPDCRGTAWPAPETTCAGDGGRTRRRSGAAFHDIEDPGVRADLGVDHDRADGLRVDGGSAAGTGGGQSNATTRTSGATASARTTGVRDSTNRTGSTLTFKSEGAANAVVT